ncbi:MAG: hypothetical protein RSD40_05415, partial [Bacilli bacterium]
MILIISGCSTNKIYNNILANINNVLINNYSNNYLFRDLSTKQFDVEMFKKLNINKINDTLFFITKIVGIGSPNCYMICNNKDTIIYCDKDLNKDFDSETSHCYHCRKEVFFITENEKRLISSWDTAEIERRNLLWDSLRYDPDYELSGETNKFVVRYIVNNKKGNFQWLVVPQGSLRPSFGK